MDRKRHAALEGRPRRTDSLAALHAEHRIAMPVSPIEGVSREERRHDTQLGHAVELVFAHGLGVDHHGTMVAQRVLLRRLVQRFDQHVCCGVSVAVHQHGHTGRGEMRDTFVCR